MQQFREQRPQKKEFTPNEKPKITNQFIFAELVSLRFIKKENKIEFNETQIHCYGLTT